MDFLLDIHYGDMFLSFKVHQKIIKFWQKLIKFICNKSNQVKVCFQASFPYPSKLLINLKYFFICWRHLLLRNADQTKCCCTFMFCHWLKNSFSNLLHASFCRNPKCFLLLVNVKSDNVKLSTIRYVEFIWLLSNVSFYFLFYV